MAIINNMVANYPRDWPLWLSSYSTPPQRNHALVVTARSSAAEWWFGTFFIFPYIGKNPPN